MLLSLGLQRLKLHGFELIYICTLLHRLNLVKLLPSAPLASVIPALPILFNFLYLKLSSTNIYPFYDFFELYRNRQLLRSVLNISL